MGQWRWCWTVVTNFSFLADVGVLGQLWYDGARQIWGDALDLSPGKWYHLNPPDIPWSSPRVQVSSPQNNRSPEGVLGQFWIVKYFVRNVYYRVFTIEKLPRSKLWHGEVLVNGVSRVVWGVSQHVLVVIIVQVELKLLKVERMKIILERINFQISQTRLVIVFCVQTINSLFCCVEY